MARIGKLQFKLQSPWTLNN